MIGAAYATLFGYYFLAVMIRRPYMDMFHYIMDYLDCPRTGGFLHCLWSQFLYSEYGRVWMHLPTAANVEVFQGVAYPFLVADTIEVVALRLLIGRDVARVGLPQPEIVLPILLVRQCQASSRHLMPGLP